MLKISYAGCLGLSPAISVQFTLEMRVAAQNREKFTKTPYFGGSRSFKVIDVDIPKKLIASACYSLLLFISACLDMLSSMSVPICNHFYARKQLML